MKRHYLRDNQNNYDIQLTNTTPLSPLEGVQSFTIQFLRMVENPK